MTKLRLMAAAALMTSLAACGGSEGNVADGNVAPEANAMIYQNDAEDSANAEAEAMIGNVAPDNGAEAPAANAN